MEKGKLNYRQADTLLAGIYKCGKINGQPFRAKTLTNAQRIQPALSELYKTIEEPDDYKEFKKKEESIIETYSIQQEGNKHFFGENESIATQELTNLKKEYVAALSRRREILKEFEEKVMTLEFPFPLEKLTKSELPKELTLEQSIGISSMIIDDFSEAKEEKKSISKSDKK